MADLGSCKYVAYRVGGLPAGAFGETYVIATAMTESPGTHRYEYFVVSQRSEPHLHKMTCSFVPGEVPEDLLKVDTNFLIGEAKQQAENHLALRLFDIAEKRDRPALLDYRIELTEMNYMPLLGCWMRSAFHDKIKTIVQVTQCPPLKSYLNAVTRISFTRGPG